MKIKYYLTSLTACLILAAPFSFAAAPVMTVVSLTKVSETRIGRFDYDTVYKVNFQNGDQALASASETLISASKGTTIIDGVVQIGAVAANAQVVSNDTITLRQNRSLPFNPAEMVWNESVVPVVASSSSSSSIASSSSSSAVPNGPAR